MNLQAGQVDIREIVLRNINKDEADCRKIGILHRFMQLSALSPATRNSHAERHGLLFTGDEVRHWLAKDDNAIGCKCSFTLVLVDSSGNPQFPDVLDRTTSARKKFFAERQAGHHTS